MRFENYMYMVVAMFAALFLYNFIFGFVGTTEVIKKIPLSEQVKDLEYDYEDCREDVEYYESRNIYTELKECEEEKKCKGMMHRGWIIYYVCLALFCGGWITFIFIHRRQVRDQEKKKRKEEE